MQLQALFRIASLLGAPGGFRDNARKMLEVMLGVVDADRAVLRSERCSRRASYSWAERSAARRKRVASRVVARPHGPGEPACEIRHL